MAGLAKLLRNPGGKCALGIGAAYLICWALLMGLWPKACYAGVPLITWSMMVLSVVAILFSVVLIFKMETFDRQ